MADPYTSGYTNTLSGGLQGVASGGGINSILDPMGIFRMMGQGGQDVRAMYGNAVNAGNTGYNQAMMSSNNGYNTATGSANAGYNNAQGYLNPYAQSGQNAMNQWGQATGGLGANVNSVGPMGQQQWQSAQMSPQQYYQNIMSGYQMSPQAQYAQQVATRAGNSAAAASGMIGSGAFVNGMQRNANQISQGDQQQYFNNVMGSNTAQMGALQNYQGQQAQYLQNLQDQARLGYGATSQQAQNAMQNGMTQGQWAMMNGANQGGYAMQNAGNQGNWAMNAAGQMVNADQTGLQNLFGLGASVASFL